MIAAIVLVILLLLLLNGTPVGFGMLVSGGLGLFLIGGTRMVLGLLETTALSTVSSYELITIPMFLLMAEFILVSGAADDLFIAAAAWVGRVRGGLGVATALAGAGFAAVCGTSTASAATLASTSLPAMIKQGYEPKLAAGAVAISGTLAMLIPPSVGLVVYGLIAEVSISKLLIAGIVPGLIVTFAIALTIWVLVLLDPSRAPVASRHSMLEKLRLLKGVAPILFLFLGVTICIYAGIATPTETSAMGAIGGLLVLIWRRKASFDSIQGAAVRAARNSCMIVAILLGAHLFGYFFALTQLTQGLVTFVAEIAVPPHVTIALIILTYLVLGTFMDQLAILILTTPIVLPVVVAIGYDPVWFGVILIITAEVGLITPPMGLNVFVVARYADRPVAEVFRGVGPHFLAHLVVIFILCAFPEIILWLPSKI